MPIMLWRPDWAFPFEYVPLSSSNQKLIMKRSLLSLILFFALGLATASLAQVNGPSKEQTKELKVQEKVRKAKVDYVNTEKAIEKENARLNSLKTKFEKDRAAGKLSPNDIDKINKRINKQTAKIKKMERKMESLKQYIHENEVPLVSRGDVPTPGFFQLWGLC